MDIHQIGDMSSCHLGTLTRRKTRSQTASEMYAYDTDNTEFTVISHSAESLNVADELEYLQSFVDAEDLCLPSDEGKRKADAELSVEIPPKKKHIDPISALESTFCKDFQCCGLQLNDMHELLQHYEDCHVHLDDSDCPEAEISPWYGPDAVFDIQPHMPFSSLTECLTPSVFDGAEMDGPMSAFDNSYIKKVKPVADEVLVRRVGDVEDDLNAALLEIWSREMQHDGKRLKMMTDVVGTSSSVAKKSSKSDSNGASDDEVDVVTVDHSVGGDDESIKGEEKAKRRDMFFDDNGNRIEKPYKCTHPGCDKAYKNPNGLKYHNIHGHCGGEEEDMDFIRVMKPYVCNYPNCFKRYKNLNGLKYHIEKSHGRSKIEANQLATNIVKKTNADFGIHSRSVPSNVLLQAMKDREEKDGVAFAERTLIPKQSQQPNTALSFLAPRADGHLGIPVANQQNGMVQLLNNDALRSLLLANALRMSNQQQPSRQPQPQLQPTNSIQSTATAPGLTFINGTPYFRVATGSSVPQPPQKGNN